MAEVAEVVKVSDKVLFLDVAIFCCDRFLSDVHLLGCLRWRDELFGQLFPCHSPLPFGFEALF
jgi:hypothetical protein